MEQSNKTMQFRPVLMGISFSVGVILGVLGTALHGNLHMVGTVQDGFVLPWGAGLALLICLLAQLWAGLRAESVLEPTAMGMTTFSVVTAAYMWWGNDQLMVPYSPEAMEFLPGPTIASMVWWLGSALITLVSMILVKWILAREAIAQAEQRASAVSTQAPSPTTSPTA